MSSEGQAVKDKKIFDISKNAQIIDYMPLAKKMAIPYKKRFGDKEALRQIEWVGGRMLWSGRALNRS
ncbi:hypothetical protein H7F10_14495 [Acidithiobacillus sp. HP-6]|uniref:hypothetical protein n=1 Tax=unclassified Acidithiobacillus TaxID=2614800 RepID=UPI001879BDA1|nr:MULTISPECIES: hypothetical protein [unclassified Acidithiobacillus]MBE7564111.1 hypothetical protein [Acidithiobacillus sp. HP-6]MBE7570812.1 hypothetical protein [Acidithiobacillus sp. HP-2]